MSFQAIRFCSSSSRCLRFSLPRSSFRPSVFSWPSQVASPCWSQKKRNCSDAGFIDELESSCIRPRKSLLFVPADDMKKITKAASLPADCVVLECEDGVAMNRKVPVEFCFINSLINPCLYKNVKINE